MKIVLSSSKCLNCMAYGETYAQAVTNAQKIIEEWIETARARGQPIPEPKERLMYV